MTIVKTPTSRSPGEMYSAMYCSATPSRSPAIRVPVMLSRPPDDGDGESLEPQSGAGGGKRPGQRRHEDPRDTGHQPRQP